MTLESSRFEDGNEYEYEIKLKVFARVLKKTGTPESFIFLFSFFFPPKKVNTVIYTEVGEALSRSQSERTSHI